MHVRHVIYNIQSYVNVTLIINIMYIVYTLPQVHCPSIVYIITIYSATKKYVTNDILHNNINIAVKVG